MAVIPELVGEVVSIEQTVGYYKNKIILKNVYHIWGDTTSSEQIIFFPGDIPEDKLTPGMKISVLAFTIPNGHWEAEGFKVLP